MIKSRVRRAVRSTLARVPLIGHRADPVAQRRWLLEQLPQGSVGAEIGVWKGDFSASILAVVKPRTLHLIDPWRSAADEAHSRTLYARGQAEMDAIERSVRERLRSEIAAGTVVIHRAPSQKAARAIADGSLDWVYIDGDHAYEAVRDDIATYLRKVRPGGLVSGDDYRVGGQFPGAVKRAVDEAVSSGAVTLVIQRDRQFILRAPGGQSS